MYLDLLARIVLTSSISLDFLHLLSPTFFCQMGVSLSVLSVLFSFLV